MARKTDTDLKLTQLPQTPSVVSSKPADILALLLAGIQKADAEVGRGLSLTSAVQLSRSWIDRRHKTLGFGRIAEVFKDLGYSHANAKNVRQAYDSEDTALVRELAKTEEGRSFLEALDAIINGEPAAADAKAHRIPPAAPAPASSKKTKDKGRGTDTRKATSARKAASAPANPPMRTDNIEPTPQFEARADAPKPVILRRLE